MSERTVYSCFTQMMPDLFRVSRAVWSGFEHLELSQVRLVIGPCLGNRTAFAFEVTNARGHVSYASDATWGLAAELSKADELFNVESLSGDGRTNEVVLAIHDYGRTSHERAGLTREHLYMFSPGWGADLDAMYGFGQFGLRGVELFGTPYPLDGEEPDLSGLPETRLPTREEFSFEALVAERVGPPGPLDAPDRGRLEDLLELAASLGESRPPDEQLEALRRAYPAKEAPRPADSPRPQADPRPPPWEDLQVPRSTWIPEVELRARVEAFSGDFHVAALGLVADRYSDPIARFKKRIHTWQGTRDGDGWCLERFDASSRDAQSSARLLVGIFEMHPQVQVHAVAPRRRDDGTVASWIGVLPKLKEAGVRALLVHLTPEVDRAELPKLWEAVEAAGMAVVVSEAQHRNSVLPDTVLEVRSSAGGALVGLGVVAAGAPGGSSAAWRQALVG